MGIANACEKSIRAAKLGSAAQNEITEYCNSYAQKILGNPTFRFDKLPEEIVNTIFHAKDKAPEQGWSNYLKSTVKRSLAH